MKITDFDTRVLRYIMTEFGIDRHSRNELRRAFIVSVGRIALKHFRELDTDDPDFVDWNGATIAIGGHPDPEYRRATRDRLRAHRRSNYFARRFGAQVRHIVDWLDIATRHSHPWLSNVDDKGRPKKLMKCATIEQLHREAEKQFRIIAQQQRQNAPLDTNKALTSTDIKWAAALGGDLHLVQLLSVAALDAESDAMGHCIGLGSYDARVEGDQRRFSYWSVRNDDGVPLATIEARESVVRQLSGRGNGHAPRPVRKAVERYMESVGWKYTADRDQDFDFEAYHLRLRLQTDFWRLERHLGRKPTLDDIRRFTSLPVDDKLLIVGRLREQAGFGPDQEVPRVHDPVTEVYHDGDDFVERVVDDDEDDVYMGPLPDYDPPRPR
jgi:hypothetical protein